MANCENLCTASKCQELEDRITALEEILGTIQIALQSYRTNIDEHIAKPTGEAHEWDIYFDNIEFRHDTSPEWQDILLYFEVLNGKSEYLTEFYQWSERIPYVPETEFFNHVNGNLVDGHNFSLGLTVDIQAEDGSNRVAVNIDDEIEAEAFINTEPLTFTITERLDSITGKVFDFETALGNKIGTDTLAFDQAINSNNEITNVVDNYFNSLDFFFRIDDLPNNDWDFVITIGDRTRNQILDLPAFSGGGGGGGSGEQELPPTALSLGGYYDIDFNNLNLSVNVNGKTATAIIDLDDMPFDNIQNSLDEILNALNIELSGQYEVGQTDTTLLDANGDKIIDYSKYIPLTDGQEGYVDTSYTDNGLVGLHQAIIALDKKITTVHKDLAKAVDPQVALEVIAPTNCYENVSRSDYTEEEWELLPQNIKDEIEKDFGDRFRDFVLGNPVLEELFEPLLRTIGSLAFKLPSLPAFFALNFASNFLIHQLKDDHPIDCAYVKPLNLDKEIETVTIVASPEVQANIKDNVLVLDFTTVEAFPNLNEIRNKWRVQIPAPIETITWESLQNIRWFRGGLYGQLKFVGRKNTTSGWFRSKEDGENYFNQIAKLTTLEIENISFSEHSNPKISPIERLTRVYRGFKVFVSDNGEPNNELTQVFKPPVNAE